MNNTLEHIAKKYNLDFSQKPPFRIEGGRKGLASLFRELGFTIGAEIGVRKGSYSEVLCQTIPGLKFYGIDSWAVYGGYADAKDQKAYNEHYEAAKLRLAPFNCNLIIKYSLEAAKDFEDGSLDFIYLDANHDFPHVTEDINAWEKKVKIGGIISGHDFMTLNDDSNKIHVEDVVRAWTHAYGINPWFVITGDRSPGWMWVKTK